MDNPDVSPPDRDQLVLEEQAPVLSNIRLFLFATGQLTLWAAHAAGILETAFALPVIQNDLNVSEAGVQWVAASYLLTWGCFQLVAGRLCDIFGRKKGFLAGCGAFILFNIISTFMPNLVSLIVCRGLCGLSSAVSVPASAGLIGSLFPPGRKRALAYAAITCGGAAGAAAGELFAGVFIERTKWTWRPCFFTVGLVSLFPLIMTILLVPVDLQPVRRVSVDWPGSGAIGIALLSFLLTLTIAQTSEDGWKTPYLPALLVLSAISFIVFIWRQRQLTAALSSSPNRKPPPLVPHGLLSWRNRNLLVIYLASFCLWAATDTLFVLASYLYFDILHIGALEAGLKFSVTFFSGSAAALIVALTVSQVPPRILMTAGCLISIISPVLFATRDISEDYWRNDLWAFLLVAYGTDATIAAGSTIISQTALPEDQSVAASLFQTSCRLGSAVGLVIASQVRHAVKGEGTLLVDELRGIRAGFWTLTGFLGGAALLIGLCMKGWSKLDKEGTDMDG